MTPPTTDYTDYYRYLSESVMEPFYTQRLEGIRAMRLASVLSRKNPYLFKAKNIETPGDLARSVVDAFLSSQEETVFGNLMEGFAVHVSGKRYGGFKRPDKEQHKSVDLEFRRDGVYYLVGIKSGVNWGNSDQINGMRSNFRVAKARLRESGIEGEIVAVNGCIYGKENVPLRTYTPRPGSEDDRAEGREEIVRDKTYYKYAGQEFWQFISGDDTLYRQIIVPIDAEARQKDDVFRRAYTAKVNELTLEFSLNFLDSDNQIDWLKLVDYVSGREKVALVLAPQAEQVSDQQTALSLEAITEE